MQRGRTPLRRRVCLVGVLTVVAACHESDAPTEPLADPPISFSVTDPFTGSLPIGNTSSPNGTLALPTYPTPMLLKITVSGQTTVTPYPDTYPPYQLDAAGETWAGHCSGGMYIRYYPYEWWPMVPCLSRDYYTPQSSISGYAILGGTGYATRTGGVGGLYSYAGALSVTLEPVKAKVSVKASKYVVTPNQTVTFTASISPSAVGPLPIPWSIHWRWVPDAGSQTTPCGAAITCPLQVAASGTMFVDAVVNGEAQTASVHIRVINCLTGNPLLDSLPILDGLKLAMDSSGVSDSNPAARRERKIQIKCDIYGCRAELLPLLPLPPLPDSPGDGPCKSTFPPADSTVIGEGHVHPFRPFSGLLSQMPYGTWDSLPDMCVHRDPQDPSDTLRHGSGFGPSQPDYNHVGGTGIPQWIMDPDSIYMIPGIPGGTPADDNARKAGKPSWGRKVGSCTRV